MMMNLIQQATMEITLTMRQMMELWSIPQASWEVSQVEAGDLDLLR